MSFTQTAFLKFADEAEWKEVAKALGVLVIVQPEKTPEDPNPAPVEQWNHYTTEWAIDVVGTIYNDDGVYDENTGEVITPPTPVDGFHVNAKWQDTMTFPSNFTDRAVHPFTPKRIFLGDDMDAIKASAVAARQSA